MSADAIIYCLERVTDYREFERFCSAFLAGIGYSSIDPLGGTGDEGRDAIILSDEAARKVVFAYTVRSDWREKLASDCKRVHEKNHSPDIFVFVCTEVLSASEKDFAQKFVSEKYGWELDLFDLERLRVQLVGSLRHLLAHHPNIFTPPFFPQRGGQSIVESRDIILIDHVSSDTALATWLARQLSLAGFRTWCNGTAPLAGEDVDETVRKLLEVRAAQYLPVISNSSLSATVFLERSTIAANKENFLLPCSLIITHDSRLPSKLTKLKPAYFNDSWKVGLGQVVEWLSAQGVKPSLDSERGRQIALRDFLPKQLTVTQPEPVFANVFPLQLPKTMLVFDVSRSLTENEMFELAKSWAFVQLGSNRYVAFTPPPDEPSDVIKIDRTSEFIWEDISVRDGKRTSDIAKMLTWRSLDIVCAQKGLEYCNEKRIYYFPKRGSVNWNQSIKHVDDRITTVQLTGERTKGWGDRASPFLYQLSPKFRPQRDIDGSWHVIVNVYIRVTTLEGAMFDPKEIGRRRKTVSKSWWNKEWLARLLGTVQALQTSEGVIEIGEGGRLLQMQTKPLSWQCPVGLDVMALASMADIGQEIAEYRFREEEEEEDEITPLTEEIRGS